MLNKNKLKVGDTIFKVTEKNLVFNRKKIHREIDGQDWFRYETPFREYNISTYVILGILNPKLEGKWPEDENYSLETEYYVLNDQDKLFTTWLDEDTYFSNYEDAETHMKKLEEDAKEIDKNENF